MKNDKRSYIYCLITNTFQAPINDHRAASGFIGITPSTQKAHLIRALLESIVFRLVQLIETAEEETKQKLRLLRYIFYI